MQPKYGSKVKLSYMDTGKFLYEIKTGHSSYRDVAKDVEIRFDTSRYLKVNNRSLSIGRNKRVTSIMKD